MRILIVILVSILFHLTLFTQVLPDDRKVDWYSAGNQEPLVISDTLNIIDFISLSGTPQYWDNTLLSAQIALNGAPGVIFFPSGEYHFENSISLQSGLVLKGESALESTFIFDLGGNDHLIKMQGSSADESAYLSSNGLKGQSTISTSSDWSFSLGDVLILSMDDSELVTSDWALGSVGQVLHVENSSNESVSISSQLRLDYTVDRQAFVRKITPIENAGLECLSIVRLDVSDSHVSNVSLDYAYNCYVRGIESSDCNYSHIAVSHSSNILIENSYFHDGHSYGSGGKAYGVALQYSTGDCLVQNNVFKHLRHSVLLQAGANGNVIAYNYSIEPFWEGTFLPSDAAGDLVLHGNYPFSNLFEGNYCQNIVIDDSHGINGPNNTFLRNRADLYGIFMGVSPASDAQNFIGNEITDPGFSTGLYFLNGENHFEYGNNDNGVIIPNGEDELEDISYYRYTAPEFVVENNWPSFGAPNILGEGVLAIGIAYDFGNWPQCLEREEEDQEVSSVKDIYSANADKLAIYPNPSRGFLYVNMQEIIGRIDRIYIRDLQSRVLFESEVNDKIERLDLHELPDGMYTLLMIGEFGELSKPFIVVK